MDLRVEIKMNDIYDAIIDGVSGDDFIRQKLLENNFDLSKPIGRIKDEISVLFFQ